MKEPPDIEVKESTPDPKPWLRCDDQAKLNILNLQEISLDYSLHFYLRKIAAELQLGRPYASTGSLFYAMPSSAVNDFYLMQQGFDTDYLEWIASSDADIRFRLKNLTIFAFLAARAEGLTEVIPKVLMEALPALCNLIKLEWLYRQGRAKVNYFRYSLFTSDYKSDKI